jgi:hypothetical protein
MRVEVLFLELLLLLSAIYTTGVDANRSPSLGLNSSNLQLNGIAFGAIPAFKERYYPNTPSEINAKLPRPISIVSFPLLWFGFFPSPPYLYGSSWKDTALNRDIFSFLLLYRWVTMLSLIEMQKD